MADLNHMDLMLLRKQHPEPFMQEALAPLEHRAWAREYVQDNPVTGPVAVGMLTPAYQLAKALRLGNRDATSPSVDQLFAGYQGLADALRGWQGLRTK